MLLIQLTNCTKGPCAGPLPDVYVDFVQGGQSIDGVYVIPPEGRENDTDWKPDWNFLMSLPWIIQSPAKQGEGDEQMVVSGTKPAGKAPLLEVPINCCGKYLTVWAVIRPPGAADLSRIRSSKRGYFYVPIFCAF